jgi:ribonuclease J
LPVAHNIPHGVALLIESPEGSILHSGDLKLDNHTFDGRTLDLSRLARRTKRDPIDLLLLDSTNANVPGRTISEGKVRPAIEQIFRTHSNRRIICSTFASNVYRHQAFIEVADSAGRSTTVLGRSLEQNLATAEDLGLVDLPASVNLGRPDHTLTQNLSSSLILTTGSQAEPMSGLKLMVEGKHKLVNIGSQDTLVLTSSRVPGNERSISDMVNVALSKGAEIVDIENTLIHASGHASSADLTEIIETLHPLHLIPIHGEERHLQGLVRIALRSGAVKNTPVVHRDGARVNLQNGKLTEMKPLHSVPTPVDDHLEQIANDTIGERDYLGKHGLVTATVVLRDSNVTEVRLQQRGWVSEAEFNSIDSELRGNAMRILASDSAPALAPQEFEHSIRKALKKVIDRSQRGRPRILYETLRL